ncbi:MAG: LON peptidase substrate-binding domain-containing protein [Kiritimatiellae bacterium]|nr:LON peptidase substrate-binding domain-containing protein [Kiritimatiellia bacterium]
MKSNSPEILPLFSLPMIVLPDEVAALHIFEPRYVEMVGHCRLEPNPEGDFVLQYQEEDRSAAYATAVVITKVLREHEDGRLEMLIKGVRRVEVIDRLQLHLYHSAKFLAVKDDEEDWDNELANRVYALHRQVLVAVTGDEPPDSFYEQEGGIAFKVAACGGMDMRNRLKLLKSSSENERLRLVEGHLQGIYPLIQDVLPRMQSIAGSFALSQAD